LYGYEILSKNWDIWNTKFQQNSTVSYLFFFYFFYFWYFISNFVYLYLSTNCRNFYVFLFYGLEILSKNFRKSWNIFQKKNIHLKSKILHKFHRFLFVFFIFFYHFGNLFFPISPIQTYQKILNIFVVLYCTDYRFYQWILENSWIFIKKIRDTLNTKYFQNSIVYYLLF